MRQGLHRRLSPLQVLSLAFLGFLKPKDEQRQQSFVVFIATNCKKLTRNFLAGISKARLGRGQDPVGRALEFNFFSHGRLVRHFQLNNLCLVVSGTCQPCQTRCVCVSQRRDEFVATLPSFLLLLTMHALGTRWPRRFTQHQETSSNSKKFQVSLKRHLSLSIEK